MLSFPFLLLHRSGQSTGSGCHCDGSFASKIVISILADIQEEKIKKDVSRTWGIKGFLQLLTSYVNVLSLLHAIKVFTTWVQQPLSLSQREAGPWPHVKTTFKFYIFNKL